MRPCIVRLLAVCCLSVFALSSCAEKNAGICEASVKETLINPETAEFFDFSSISKSEAAESLANKLSSEYDGLAASAVKEETISSFNRKMAEFSEAKFYKMRLKADGKLGNKITQNQMCTVINAGCICVEAE